MAVLAAVFAALTALLLLHVLIEQLTYLRKKGPLPGPAMVLPFLGTAIPMVRSPTTYWRDLAISASPNGLSANYLVGRFILFIRSTDLSHKILTNVRPDAFQVIGHPFGKKLFGDHNLIYMFGDPHKSLRRRISLNFSPSALSTYQSLQLSIIRRHLDMWLRLPQPLSLRLLCRDMNLETSQSVFVGPYLTTQSRKTFAKDYNLFNQGLMSLPVDLPGFAFRKARLAVGRLVDTLSVCVSDSKRKMGSSSDAEPTCLVDFWTKSDPDADPKEVAGHLFDFLFAAQDASTSSLLWAVALLESHPEVLRRVREEVDRVCGGGGRDGCLTAEETRGLKYTEAVAREVLRYRPPATMVPHVALEEFELTEGYRVPKGTIVFPSLFESSFQGFTEPDRFDPGRFGEGRQEDRVYRTHFLTFGAGPHQCAGQRYAVNHLVLFIATFVSTVDFKRHWTDGCDEIMYNPTIVPRDGCTVYLSPRV
ncbi:hypothetical protein QJS10_CPB14g00469 [Acorus calamus]|uniref:C-22 sterol desaturase n=1 Tax=Acorus calamus TaxID=4465 RepID=A0AAV9DBK9_ACOCL|nr:hypothetical protein QJS10_CPB14g00469 [Acorus calamus]